MSIPMIAGYYPYTRNGVTHPPRAILKEIPASLRINPSYRENLLVLAGDQSSAQQLEKFGLQAHRIFEDAPMAIHRDTAHKMKHWMCLWALREFGEFLWVDWDTVLLKEPDQAFWDTQICVDRKLLGHSQLRSLLRLRRVLMPRSPSQTMSFYGPPFSLMTSSRDLNIGGANGSFKSGLNRISTRSPTTPTLHTSNTWSGPKEFERPRGDVVAEWHAACRLCGF